MDAPSGSGETSTVSPAAVDQATETPKVYQFQVFLKRIKPKIWRRIQVPSDFNFAQLHITIQCVMGWKSAWMDYHLHVFKKGYSRKEEAERNKRLFEYWENNEEAPEELMIEEIQIKPTLDKKEYKLFEWIKVFNEETTKLTEFFKNPKDTLDYTYDLGDEWNHVIVLEKILPLFPLVTYPVCLAGRSGMAEDPPRYECECSDADDCDGECGGYYEPGDEEPLTFNKKDVSFKPPDWWIEKNGHKKHKYAYF